jgi:glycosyltransferase involved in cell wall biosynthesis
MVQGVLVIAPFFRPSKGGAESYIDEVVSELAEAGYKVYVQTYQPLYKGIPLAEKLEVNGNVTIRRYKWIGGDLFHRLSKFPALVFLYITPYLFFRVFLWLVINHKKISIIDGQGLNACFIAKILGGIFKIQRVSTVLALYNFQDNSLFKRLASWAILGSKKVFY